MPNAAELKIDGKSLELPIVVETEAEKAIAMRQLRAQTGCVTGPVDAACAPIRQR
jgi:citrate synthase